MILSGGQAGEEALTEGKGAPGKLCPVYASCTKVPVNIEKVVLHSEVLSVFHTLPAYLFLYLAIGGTIP